MVIKLYSVNWSGTGVLMTIKKSYLCFKFQFTGLPSFVKIVEVGPRDGLQNEKVKDIRGRPFVSERGLGPGNFLK